MADRLTEIAEREGMSRSALVAKIVTRYVDNYPLDDVTEP